MHSLLSFLIVASLSLGSIARSWGQVVLSGDRPSQELDMAVYYLEDPSHGITFEEMRGGTHRAAYHRLPSANPNFGFTNSTYWIMFSVRELPEAEPQSWLLELGYSAYAEVDLYVVDSLGQVSQQAVGDWRPHPNRVVSFHNYVFPLNLSAQGAHRVFLRMRPLVGQVVAPLILWESRAFSRYAESYTLFWGIYLGMLLIFLLYHAVLYAFNWRERGYEGYLYLSLYLTIYLVFEMTRGSCLGIRFIWPENRWMADYSFVTLFFCTIVALAAFYGRVLDMGRCVPRLALLIRIALIGWAVVLGVLYSGIMSFSKNAVILFFGAGVGGLIIVAAFFCWRKKPEYRPAFYYFLAATMLYAGGVVLLMTRWGLLPSGQFWTMNALNIGSMLEFVMLSVGISLQVKSERERKQRALQRDLDTQITDLEASFSQEQKEERRELSMMLHDQFGNELWVLRQNIQKLYQDYIGTSNADRFQDLLDTIRKILAGIRVISRHYVPDQFEEKGLAIMLHDMAQRLSDTTGISFKTHLKGQESLLPLRSQLQLYYALFELCANIAKHCGGREAALVSFRKEGFYNIQIRDDGQGGLPIEGESQGSGLGNVRRRLESIGATFTVSSLAGQGTFFKIRLPIPVQQDRQIHI
jgi:two-component system, sensor histidine kinase LadS